MEVLILSLFICGGGATPASHPEGTLTLAVASFTLQASTELRNPCCSI